MLYLYIVGELNEKVLVTQQEWGRVEGKKEREEERERNCKALGKKEFTIKNKKLNPQSLKFPTTKGHKYVKLIPLLLAESFPSRCRRSFAGTKCNKELAARQHIRENMAWPALGRKGKSEKA